MKIFSYAKQAAARTVVLWLALIAITVLGAVNSYAQGINYPVGSPAGTSGTGNGRTDPDNYFMRNNVAGLTEIPVNEEEERTGVLGDSGKGGWRMYGELQESVYKYTRERIFASPFQGVESKALIVNPGLAGEMTYTSGNHKYGLGFGGYQMFGFQSKFIDPPEKFGARAQFFDTRVASNDFAIGGAVRVTKKLSIGAAFIIGRGFLDLKAPTVEIIFFRTIQSRLDINKIGAPGVDISVDYRPSKYVSFGFNYKSKRTYNLEGEFETLKLDFSNGVQIVPVVPKVKVEFQVPTVAEGGIAIKPSNKLIFAFDFRFYDYTATFGKQIDVKDKTSGKVLQSLKINGKDVRSVRFGTVYSLSDNTKIFGGMAFTSNGFPEASINPGLVNVGGLDVSGGFAKRLYGQWVNFAVAGVFGRPRTVGPPANPTFPGRYKGKGVLFSVGLRLKLTKIL